MESAGSKRQPAFCFLGLREDTFMNPRLNLEASPDPKGTYLLG